jgi:ketosteroid isomerase-like protein
MRKVQNRRPLIAFTILCLMSIMLVKCVPEAETNLPIDRSKTIVAEKFEEWRLGRSNFFELLADSVVWEVSGRSPVSGVYSGKNDFLNRSVQPITSKLKTRIVPELISLTADEKYVWLHWRGKATSLLGASYENQYVWKLELKDGKIISAVAFLDTFELNALIEAK